MSIIFTTFGWSRRRKIVISRKIRLQSMRSSNILSNRLIATILSNKINRFNFL